MEEFERWEKISEWRGHTVATLEAINSELKDLKSEISNLNDKVDDINNKLTAQTIKIGVTGGVMGLIAGTVISIFWDAIL